MENGCLPVYLQLCLNCNNCRGPTADECHSNPILLFFFPPQNSVGADADGN